MNSQRDNTCKSLAKVSYGDIIIAPAVRFDEFHGLHKYFFPPNPQQGAQRCLYWIQSNDSRDFEHPVFTSIGVVLIDWLSS